MGELIRLYLLTVGHTLGLRHNMGNKYRYSVENLEMLLSKEWPHTSSIMDYARFNYVAQPKTA